jgi:hypothetical protein
MYVEVKAAKDRRVRHPVSRKILQRDRVYRVKWSPVWERKKRDGDIEMVVEKAVESFEVAE